MIFQEFRAAAEVHGEYCADKNELRVRKSGETYRFICEEGRLRFVTPERQEAVFPFANDVTVGEFRRCIVTLMDSGEHGTKAIEPGGFLDEIVSGSLLLQHPAGPLPL